MFQLKSGVKSGAWKQEDERQGGFRVISHGVEQSSGGSIYSPAFKSNLTNAYSRSFALRSY